MNDKQVRGKYTQEFKLEAGRLVRTGQPVRMTAKVLGIPKASLSNWVRSREKGQLGGACDRPVTPEQMELARLRAELAREDGARHRKKSGGVLCAGYSAKYAWIRTMKASWPVSLSYEVLGVSVSGYFEHQRRQQRRRPSQPGSGRLSDEALLAHMRAIHAEARQEYCWPRMTKELWGLLKWR